MGRRVESLPLRFRHGAPVGFALALIGFGVLLTLREAGVIAEDGVVTKRIPLDGASEAQVSIVHGGGELRLGEHHDPYNLVEGTFDGGVREQVDREGDRLIARLEPARGRRSRRWDVRLKPGIPLDLVVQGGAQSSTLDLSRLLVRSLVLETGASSTSLTLPERGRTNARIRAGGASVDVRVPRAWPQGFAWPAG